ncbi:DoxX family protein [Geomonas subterranea]|uniref:DoxX family protein n=1 Tax=Geomonas subterranea TaxID=2847989 RepID=A0ABX8LRP0_9BACT|nr:MULTISPECIES: DoxX family protein [Geomonas]QXE92949.1 DoxX family protein [Geomonas subterranea]QXM08945.1 DoxX family protein [Geomonas subterranea]
MLARLLATEETASLMVLRLFLALVMFPHGAQKVLGWFGGPGFHGTMEMFTKMMGIPYLFGLMAVLTEFVGPLLLAAGLCTRLAALVMGIEIAVAALLVHLHNGFFMNWTGRQAGEGFEYHLLVVGMSLALLIGGGGRWSLDRLISRRR